MDGCAIHHPPHLNVSRTHPHSPHPTHPGPHHSPCFPPLPLQPCLFRQELHALLGSIHGTSIHSSGVHGSKREQAPAKTYESKSYDKSYEATAVPPRNGTAAGAAAGSGWLDQREKVRLRLVQLPVYVIRHVHMRMHMLIS